MHEESIKHKIRFNQPNLTNWMFDIFTKLIIRSQSTDSDYKKVYYREIANYSRNWSIENVLRSTTKKRNNSFKSNAILDIFVIVTEQAASEVCCVRKTTLMSSHIQVARKLVIFLVTSSKMEDGIIIRYLTPSIRIFIGKTGIIAITIFLFLRRIYFLV